MAQPPRCWLTELSTSGRDTPPSRFQSGAEPLKSLPHVFDLAVGRQEPGEERLAQSGDTLGSPQDRVGEVVDDVGRHRDGLSTLVVTKPA